MKKILFVFVFALVVFTSCQTSVSVSYMVPSEIDMGNYRNIALASTVPYYGFITPDRYIRGYWDIARFGYPYIRSTYTVGLKDEVASYATDRIYESLKASGYFTVLEPEVTDSILDLSKYGLSTRDNLLKRGVDAVIIPKIDMMSVNEYIYAREYRDTYTDDKGKEHETERIVFYYDASYSLKLSYTVIDARSEQIVATRSFVVEDEDHFTLSSPIYLPNYPLSSFKTMVDTTLSRITRQLIPLETKMRVDLMDNKPENKAADRAYELVKEGNIKEASSLFYSVFNNSGHVPSGYNAALTLASSGDIKGSINVANAVYDKTASEDVKRLIKTLENIDRSNEESVKQIKGNGSVKPSNNSSSIYDAVRR